MGVRIANTIIEVGANITGLRRDSKEAVGLVAAIENRTRHLTRALQALAGAWAVREVVQWIGAGLEAVDAQAKLARRLDATIDGLRAYQIAAGDAGVAEEEAGASAETLERALGAAERGAGTAGAALRALGLEVEDLQGLDLDAKMAAIADAFAASNLTSAQTLDLLRQLGIRSTEMANFMRTGGDAIRAARQELEDYGLSISEIDAAAVEAANDEFERLGRVWRGIRDQISVGLAPFLGEVARGLNEVAKQHGGWGDVAQAATVAVVRGIGNVIDWTLKLSDFIGSLPSTATFGLLGLAFFGKRGAIVAGALGLFDDVYDLLDQTEEAAARSARFIASEYEHAALVLARTPISLTIDRAPLQASVNNLRTELAGVTDEATATAITAAADQIVSLAMAANRLQESIASRSGTVGAEGLAADNALLDELNAQVIAARAGFEALVDDLPQDATSMRAYLDDLVEWATNFTGAAPAVAGAISSLVPPLNALNGSLGGGTGQDYLDELQARLDATMKYIADESAAIEQSRHDRAAAEAASRRSELAALQQALDARQITAQDYLTRMAELEDGQRRSMMGAAAEAEAAGHAERLATLKAAHDAGLIDWSEHFAAVADLNAAHNDNITAPYREALQQRLDATLGFIEQERVARQSAYAQEFYDEAERRTALDAAYAENLIGLEAYHRAKEELERGHQERMAALRRLETQSMLSEIGGALGAVGDLIGTENEKNFKIAKAFKIAGALVDAGAAIMQVWADPSNPTLIGKIAATAAVAARTMQTIAQMKAVQPGSGGSVSAGGGGAGGAGAGPAPVQRTMLVHGFSANQRIAGADAIDLIKTINELQKDGYVVDVVYRSAA